MVGSELGEGAGAGPQGPLLRSLHFILHVMGVTGGFEHEADFI